MGSLKINIVHLYRATVSGRYKDVIHCLLVFFIFLLIMHELSFQYPDEDSLQKRDETNDETEEGLNVPLRETLERHDSFMEPDEWSNFDETDMNGVVDEVLADADKRLLATRRKSKSRARFGNVEDDEEFQNRFQHQKMKKQEIDDTILLWDDEQGVFKKNWEDDHEVSVNRIGSFKDEFKDHGDDIIGVENQLDPDYYGDDEDNDDDLKEGPCMTRIQYVKDSLANIGAPQLQCSIMESSNEDECRTEERSATTFYSEDSVYERLQDCHTYFQKIETLAELKITQEEKELPLAFSIVAHSQLSLIEAQLATLFRPHNSYCIYIDKKADANFRSDVEKLIFCYQRRFGENLNLFIAPDPVSVFWSDFSLIQADLDCLRLLLQKELTWKYFINQAGSALPQISIFDIVNRLRRHQDSGGDSVVISRPFPKKYRERIDFKYRRPSQAINRQALKASFGRGVDDSKLKNLLKAFEQQRKGQNQELSMYSDLPKRTFVRKEAPPLGLKIFKGLKEVVLSRSTAKFFLESEVGRELASWCEDITFAEEILFQTLIRVDRDIYEKHGRVVQNLEPDLDTTGGICVRRSLWEEDVRQCFGKMKRYICNLALADLPEAMEKDCLFLNKFDLTVDVSPVRCLQQHWSNALKGI